MSRLVAASVALAAVAVALGVTAVDAKDVVIDNAEPRRDVAGNIMDAHDGNIAQWKAGGMYYMYAMSYGLCKENPKNGCTNTTLGACGFRLDHNVSVFVSPDLSNGSWRYAGDALPVANRPVGVYYRPKVVYNANTEKYVLWINIVPDGNFQKGTYLVATSASPAGPFDVIQPNVKTHYPAPGDFSLLVDDDAAHTAYLIYTSVAMGHNMSVEQLDRTYSASMAVADPGKYNSGFLQDTFVEAPIIFKRGGLVYALTGHCCCFCKEGSGTFVYTAPSPLGPYTRQGQIGRYANGTSVTHAQPNDAFPVVGADGSTSWVWTGDQWQSAPDHIKGHDFQYWAPLRFLSGPHGGLDSFEYTTEWSLNVGN